MATTSSLSRNFPTLRYLAAPFRWFFRSRRRAWTAAVVLLAMIAAPPLWWSLQLLGLPDIGDPFDVEEFRKSSIPDDRNAFVLYRRAAERLKPMISSSRSEDNKMDLTASWSKADPRVRRWVEENRGAMEFFRRGAERPDAMAPDRDRPDQGIQAVRALHWLAMLEASRLEEQGDMAGAWGWYRAALRATYHLGRHGSLIQRMIADRWRGTILTRLGTWSVDRRTTRAMVRQALDEVIVCEALAPSESYTIKADYQLEEGLPAGPHNPGRGRLVLKLRYTTLGSKEYQMDPNLIEMIVDAWRFWRREPERGRRVFRLVIANWLACYDRPPDLRPAPDPNVSGMFELYEPGPESPAKARALSPEALDRWLSTSTDAQELLRDFDLRAVRIRERASYRGLVILLASRLYRRDRGADPPSDEALVGPYLESLPDDGSGDVRDTPSQRTGSAVQ